jgi:hypothetical protein
MLIVRKIIAPAVRGFPCVKKEMKKQKKKKAEQDAGKQPGVPVFSSAQERGKAWKPPDRQKNNEKKADENAGPTCRHPGKQGRPCGSPGLHETEFWA